MAPKVDREAAFRFSAGVAAKATPSVVEKATDTHFFRQVLRWSAVFLAFLITAIFFQSLGGAYGGEFSVRTNRRISSRD